MHISGETIWLLIGFAGQGVFFSRFLLQWIHSERAKASVVPVAFWYLSIAGGLIILIYSIHRHDIVFIAGQGLGIFIYLRNLMLIRASRNAQPADLGPSLK